MMLAAISFADPLMLAGLLAALVPVVLHLLNRVKAPVVQFPTLRFLRITAQKTARRRQIQQYFLLLVRVVVFALLAIAVAGPLIRGGRAGLAYGFVGMLLAGLALLVVAGVAVRAAMEGRSTATPAEAAPEGPVPPQAAGTPARYWAMSLGAGLAALLLGGFSAWGLLSDHFFAGDTGSFTGQSTALVVILDNSYSMLAREGEGEAGASATRLATARELVRQLLTDTVRPAEAAVLLTNPGDRPPSPALTRDTVRLLGSLEYLEARGRTLPMRERIRAALALLEGSVQPSKMLVIASDFARPAFADAEVLAGIRESAFRRDLQVVFLSPGGGNAPPTDVGVASFGVAEGSERPAVGTEIVFEAVVVNNGDAADVREFVLTLDGQPVAGTMARVQLGAAGTGAARTTVRLPCRLKEPGLHRFGIELSGAGGGATPDAMAWDDRREVVLDVAQQVQVLVIGGDGADGTPRPRSAAFYFMAALAPFEGAGTAMPWSIRPTYRGIEGLHPAQLAGKASVFLCDVPRLPPAAADALLRYVKTGGRLVWVLGPAVDAANYNEVLAKRGLLPGPVAAPVVVPRAQLLEWVDMRSGLFAGLFENAEPFRGLAVTGRWTLAEGEGGEGTRGRPLAKLADGSALFVEHTVPGMDVGKIYTLLTTPGSDWSNLGATVLLVPMASRMAMGDAAELKGQASTEVGEAVMLRPDALASTASLDVTTPGNTAINVRARTGGAGGGGEGGSQWTFEDTLDPGVYRWRASDGKASGMFVVNPPGEEVDLVRTDVEGLARQADIGGERSRATIVAASAADVRLQLDKRSEGTPLVPGFVAMVVMLAVVESLLANRHRPTATVAASPLVTGARRNPALAV